MSGSTPDGTVPRELGARAYDRSEVLISPTVFAGLVECPGGPMLQAFRTDRIVTRIEAWECENGLPVYREYMFNADGRVTKAAESLSRHSARDLIGNVAEVTLVERYSLYYGDDGQPRALTNYGSEHIATKEEEVAAVARAIEYRSRLAEAKPGGGMNKL